MKLQIFVLFVKYFSKYCQNKAEFYEQNVSQKDVRMAVKSNTEDNFYFGIVLGFFKEPQERMHLEIRWFGSFANAGRFAGPCY